MDGRDEACVFLISNTNVRVMCRCLVTPFFSTTVEQKISSSGFNYVKFGIRYLKCVENQNINQQMSSRTRSIFIIFICVRYVKM